MNSLWAHGALAALLCAALNLLVHKDPCNLLFLVSFPCGDEVREGGRCACFAPTPFLALSRVPPTGRRELPLNGTEQTPEE